MTRSVQRGLLLAGIGCFVLLSWSYGDEVVAALRQAELRYFLAYFVVSVVVRVALVARWQAIDEAMRMQLPVRRLAVARLAADAMATISPAGRLSADPLRVVLLTGTGERTSRLAAGVALDRMIETFGNTVAALTYVAVFSAMRSGEREVLAGIAAAMAVAFVALTATLIGLARGHQPFAPVYWVVEWSEIRWLRVGAIAARRAERHIRELLHIQPWLAIGAILGSVGIEALIVVEYALLYRAFGAMVDIPMVMLSLLIGGVSRAAPTPGGVGAFEASQVAAFGAAMGRPDLGFTVGVITRVHELLWAAIGFLVLPMAGIRRRDLRSDAVAGKPTGG